MIYVKNVYKQSFHCLNLTMLHIQTDDTENNTSKSTMLLFKSPKPDFWQHFSPTTQCFHQVAKKYDISDTAINTHCPKNTKFSVTLSYSFWSHQWYYVERDATKYQDMYTPLSTLKLCGRLIFRCMSDWTLHVSITGSKMSRISVFLFSFGVIFG